MYSLINMINPIKIFDNKKEKFTDYVVENTNKPIYYIRGVIILSIMLDILISAGFIIFSLTYINEINSKITVNYQDVFLVLVYLLLISNIIAILMNLSSIYLIP